MAFGRPVAIFADPRLRASLRIAAVFLLMSYLYLYGSDWLVRVAVPVEWRFVVNVSKGFIYVTVVAVGLAYFIRKALIETQAAEENFKLLFDASPDGMALVTKEGRIETANPALCKFLGWSLAEIRRLQPGDLFDITSSKTGRIINRQNKSGEQRERIMIRRKDGVEVPVLLALKTFNLPSGDTRICAIVHELSEMEKLEAKYREGERQRLVGHLAGGVAHDFNNLLTVISGNTEILLDFAKPDTPQYRASNTIWMAGQQAALLVRQLLAFARRQPLDPAPFSVRDRLTELMPLLEKAVGAHVRLELRCGEGTWQAFADASQFENAVLNLVLNAKDALRDDKTIVIEAVNVLVGQRSPFDEVLVPGDYVALSVTDHGTGMTPDVASRAIEPFFTTKDAGHGIGLGLSTVFGFSKQSGGHLDIRSEPDKGTVVTLYLPRPFGDGHKDPSDPQSNGALGGDERILIVEDDALVRVFLDNALTQLGYRVITVADAEEALSLLGSHSEIDLVIADVIGGREFVTKLESSHPDLAVLFISGLPDKAPEDADMPESRFEVQDIAKRIREALDKS